MAVALNEILSSVTVAIPARDEEDWIERCILALDRQSGAPALRIVLLVNNSMDRTAAVARGLPVSHPLEVIEHDFPLPERTAGYARRLVMDRAAAGLAPGGVLLCTDADAQVAPDWLAANLFHLRHADAVAGRAIIDPVDAAAIPAHLHDDDARECAYSALLDEIDSLVDPDPADPWPRHAEHSGASIGVHLDVFRRVGGVPAVAVGEDRAFFAALRGIDARIRHASDVRVTVSGRIHGRAAGGMADTIRRRMSAQDLFIDDALEPAANRIRRARLRREARDTFARTGLLPASLQIGTQCGFETFGLAWADAEARCPRLIRVVVPVGNLAAETMLAQRILDELRVPLAAGFRASWVDRALAGLGLSPGPGTSRRADRRLPGVGSAG